MNTITTNLRKLIFGATSNVLIPTPQGVNTGVYTTLLTLGQQGYAVTNPEVLGSLSQNHYDNISSIINETLSSFTIEGYKLRDSFGKTTSLEEYTSEEYAVILAQYAMTYGWENTHTALFGRHPVDVINNYVDTHDFVTKSALAISKLKQITFLSEDNLPKYIKSIVESKIPLRTNQIEILTEVPLVLLEQSFNYSIKSTEALVQTLIYKKGGTPLIKSVDSLMRFILNNGQKGNNGENYDQQILKPALKTFMFHLPTKMKKMIWDWFNATKNIKATTEQLLVHEQWWKRCFHHAQWCNKQKFNARYPIAKAVLNQLYNDDRSWTFNSRYSNALKSNHYDVAINVLKEKPGLLFRNLVMFCKYTQGKPLPLKAERGVFNKINTSSLFTKQQQNNVVKSDAVTWLMNELPNYLIETKPQIKGLWEVIEQLASPIHEEPIHSREVQGNTVYYSIPIPAINKKLVQVVTMHLIQYIRNVKQAQNTNLGIVYLEPELADICMQYSGNESSETSCSGSFLTPGSSITIPSTAQFIRMGVAWRDTGKGSCDIDLSTMGYTKGSTDGMVCFYGSPTLKRNNQIIATSSGDVTSCCTSTYSTEFIDIDIEAALTHDLYEFINTFHVYSGDNLADYDTHVFVSFIAKEERVIPNNRFTIDLAKQNYAVRLNDKAKSYIGVKLDVVARKCIILGIPDATSNSSGHNILNTTITRDKLINNMPKRFHIDTLCKVCINKSQLTTNRIEADTIIGVSNDATINVTTSGEIFTKLVL